MNKKIFIFFPDGVGLRNFAFTQFKELGEERGNQIVYWNNTVFSLKEELGYDEVIIENHKIHRLTPIYTRIRKHIELNVSRQKFNDTVYATYKFPFSYNGLKNSLISIFSKLMIGFNSSEAGIIRVRNRINALERSTDKYKYCKAQLLEHKPDLVFCTTQRATQSIGALLAAQDIGIPTVGFVYSWDNVPKAMHLIETDYYCVWSDLMKEEVLKYYPFIKESQVIVTGTPQFEPHFDSGLSQSRADFCAENNLDPTKKYICYSGDDETTSPLDQFYLEDLAVAVRNLNAKGENLAIIYRKCPVDTTTRYDLVLEKYKDCIAVLNPLWKPFGKNWNEILPTKADLKALYNVCQHSELVTNVCSSTVFDFVLHNKPCVYYNYEQPQFKKGIRDIGQNYNYVHFRSMPTPEAAVFCTDKKELENQIKQILEGKLSNVSEGKKWFEIVASEAPTEASKNIWNTIGTILKQ
ncbi:UDP-N-acetylglucosamine:LPS N-acetylglucosamine transferase [Flavobacterium gillisiae]|uniref:UDP-N-acetylglucosamine:LPS N-acetylglucosamine transferase n=1 Tax=Flavobacterium gillisiae TaxID=150146 RepID=A0A1H4EVS7_9FLAO|nr:CDP-glycerol glycerophosphotransferase family protein [Flavobacterium gillisiae]SEA89133.1 UDP-N-acetylglucosamine:LPS N-acetylglucosamine transferase [Flavobacterium gillisiae]